MIARHRDILGEEVEAIAAKTLIYGLAPNWNALPDWVKDAYKRGEIYDAKRVSITVRNANGPMVARTNDIILRNGKGEIHVCRSDIFAAIYEPVEPEDDADPDQR